MLVLKHLALLLQLQQVKYQPNQPLKKHLKKFQPKHNDSYR
jgi:hypothetical protein